MDVGEGGDELMLRYCFCFWIGGFGWLVGRWAWDLYILAHAPPLLGDLYSRLFMELLLLHSPSSSYCPNAISCSFMNTFFMSMQRYLLRDINQHRLL
jgi:hypothetical protein